MEITIKTREQGTAIMKKLEEDTNSCKIIKGGLLIEPSTLNGLYHIPEYIKDAQLFINTAEKGGGMQRTGMAMIVCGLTGKQLRPYYIPRGGHLSCGAHAFFSIPEACITITAYKSQDDITIKEHRIVRTVDKETEALFAEINSSLIWEGLYFELPEDLSVKFGNAIGHAREKACCYHCRCVHYADTSQIEGR